MTYEAYRRYGYVSLLRYLCCGSGPSNNTVNTQSALTGELQQAATQSLTNSNQQYAQYQENLQPLVQKEKALASGDRQAALAAAMPTISQISAGYGGAKQGILNNLPAGAARDKALANLELQKETGIGTAQARAVEEAPAVLAGVAQQQGGFSLQSLGAALSGYGGASSSNQALGQMQTAQSQAKWAPVLGLASAAGGAVGATDFSKLFHK